MAIKTVMITYYYFTGSNNNVTETTEYYNTPKHTCKINIQSDDTCRWDDRVPIQDSHQNEQ